MDLGQGVQARRLVDWRVIIRGPGGAHRLQHRQRFGVVPHPMQHQAKPRARQQARVASGVRLGRKGIEHDPGQRQGLLVPPQPREGLRALRGAGEGERMVGTHGACEHFGGSVVKVQRSIEVAHLLVEHGAAVDDLREHRSVRPDNRDVGAFGLLVQRLRLGEPSAHDRDLGPVVEARRECLHAGLAEHGRVPAHAVEDPLGLVEPRLKERHACVQHARLKSSRRLGSALSQPRCAGQDCAGGRRVSRDDVSLDERVQDGEAAVGRGEDARRGRGCRPPRPSDRARGPLSRDAPAPPPSGRAQGGRALRPGVRPHPSSPPPPPPPRHPQRRARG